MLDKFGHGGFHLLLTHLLSRRAYMKHYIEERQNGAYLVLDNSAHEKGEGEDAASLMAMAIKLRAQEVVVPDVLFDSEKTIDKAVHAHETWYEAGHPGMVTLNPALMYVPQGENIFAWHDCCNELLNLHMYAAQRHNIRRHCVLGISKDYEMWDGGILALMGSVIPTLAKYATRGIEIKVHLLGWGRDLWALNRVAASYPWIRSTDSAKPFVYGIHGVELDPSQDPPQYPKRPKGYFGYKMDVVQQLAAEHNVGVFMATANP